MLHSKGEHVHSKGEHTALVWTQRMEPSPIGSSTPPIVLEELELLKLRSRLPVAFRPDGSSVHAVVLLALAAEKKRCK